MLHNFAPSFYPTGGHLVVGHNVDRVRPDGATEPWDDPHEGAAQDPEERSPHIGRAVQVEQDVQRLHSEGTSQGGNDLTVIIDEYYKGWY